MESGLPPALEAADSLRKMHLLGRTRPRSSPAQARENLCGPVHAECLRQIFGRRDHSSRAVALRHVYGYAAPMLFHGTHAAYSAACLCAASLLGQRMQRGFVSGAGCQSAAARGAGSHGCIRALMAVRCGDCPNRYRRARYLNDTGLERSAGSRRQAHTPSGKAREP